MGFGVFPYTANAHVVVCTYMYLVKNTDSTHAKGRSPDDDCINIWKATISFSRRLALRCILMTANSIETDCLQQQQQRQQSECVHSLRFNLMPALSIYRPNFYSRSQKKKKACVRTTVDNLCIYNVMRGSVLYALRKSSSLTVNLRLPAKLSQMGIDRAVFV